MFLLTPSLEVVISETLRALERVDDRLVFTDDREGLAVVVEEEATCMTSISRFPAVRACEGRLTELQISITISLIEVEIDVL